MSEVNSISRGGNVGCTSPPVLVDLSITEARIELEEIVKEIPKHINALADLETIYRNLDRITDADCCRRTIDSILKNTSDADAQIKRTYRYCSHFFF
jgi:Fe2+ or Zn2+ uptake regulation protein